MGPPSLEQAHSRSDKLFPVSAIAAEAGERSFRSPPPRSSQRLHMTATSKELRGEKYEAHNWVPISDLHSPVQVVADCLLIAALSFTTGVAYHEVFLKVSGHLSEFVGTGLIVALLFSGMVRLVDGRHTATLTTRYDRLRDAVLVWSLAFAALVFFLFALKAGDSLSRGAVLTFYLAGLFVMGAWRALSPPALARITHKTGHATRECIIIGDDRNAGIDALAFELAASGHPQPTVVKFRAGCDSVAWPQEQRRLVATSIKTAHALKHGEIYICTSGVPGERLAGIQRALSILAARNLHYSRYQHGGVGQKQDFDRWFACCNRNAPRTTRPRPAFH